MIRKPIRLDRIASIITLLGALATGPSAFADTLSIGQSGTFTGAFDGYLPAYSFLTITLQGLPGSQLYSSITSNGDAYINFEYLNLYNPYSYYIVAEVTYGLSPPGYSAYDFYNGENVLPENSALILGVSLTPPTDPNQFLTYTEFNDTPEVAYFRLDGGGSGVYSVSATTPLPAALPLFATGLGGLGLLGWRRKRKAQPVA